MSHVKLIGAWLAGAIVAAALSGCASMPKEHSILGSKASCISPTTERNVFINSCPEFVDVVWCSSEWLPFGSIPKCLSRIHTLEPNARVKTASGQWIVACGRLDTMFGGPRNWTAYCYDQGRGGGPELAFDPEWERRTWESESENEEVRERYRLRSISSTTESEAEREQRINENSALFLSAMQAVQTLKDIKSNPSSPPTVVPSFQAPYVAPSSPPTNANQTVITTTEPQITVGGPLTSAAGSGSGICPDRGNSVASLQAYVSCRCAKSPPTPAGSKVIRSKDGASCVNKGMFVFGCSLNSDGIPVCTQT